MKKYGRYGWHWIAVSVQLSIGLYCLAAGAETLSFSQYTLSWPESSVAAWRYTLLPHGAPVEIALPSLEIDGKFLSMRVQRLEAAAAPRSLRNGAVEYLYEGPLEDNPVLRLQVRFRAAQDTPILRFSYALKASNGQTLTKTSGRDHITYFSLPMAGFSGQKEIRFSAFNEMFHSCLLTEVPLRPVDFAHALAPAGPMLLGANDQGAFLCAYEHDSMYGNTFLEYRLDPEGNAALCAVKGNYYDGQPADGYETIWFEAGGAANETELADQYRRFVWRYLTENTASRKPYLYYNSWGRQERVKWRGGKYLSTMNLGYTLREIDQAHAMGIEVYVLDAGWFDRTGDWGVNLNNFPDGFAQIREKLAGYGMQLGVWMNPAKAAVSSRALEEFPACLKTRSGKSSAPSPTWETEDSVDLCLVSPYWEFYADTLIRAYGELGIRYFYLDGVSQTGCDDPGHFHGTARNSLAERQECYGFLLPVYLEKIMDKVGPACPGVIFDFDVTENRRIGLGLQFLASGRYFILNNGPYFHNFDLCPTYKSIVPNSTCNNIFINPGPARTWFMRSVLDYDKWIPANLIMANYQSDDPESSQYLNLGSLVLGQNAIWGEILTTSQDGVARFNEVLTRYKQIRGDIALASPVRVGRPGDTPEIYEKILPETGKGVVTVFANEPGVYRYLTANEVQTPIWHNDGVEVQRYEDGHAEITASFAKEPAARIIFFGVE